MLRWLALTLFSASFVGLATAQVTVEESHDLPTSRQERLFERTSTLTLPIRLKVDEPKELLIVATAGGAHTEFAAKAHPPASKEKLAKDLAAALAAAGYEGTLTYGEDNGFAYAAFRHSAGRFGSLQRTSIFPYGALYTNLKRAGWDVNLLTRVREHAVTIPVGLEQQSVGNFNLFFATAPPPTAEVRITVAISGTAVPAFYFFLGFGLIGVVGMAGAYLYGRFSPAPIARRRKLYTRLTIWSTFGGIALHAPFAVWALGGRGSLPFIDLWFGTSSAMVLFPFLLGPLLILLMILPLSNRLEQKLFGPEEPTEVEPEPPPTEQHMKAKKRYRVIHITIAAAAIAIYAAGYFLLESKDARSLVRMLGLALFLFAGTIARHFAGPDLETAPATESDDRVTHLAERTATEMGVQIKEVSVDCSKQGRANANARVDLKGNITVTDRARKTLDDDELRALLAHECAHVKLRHLRRLLAFAVFITMIVVVPFVLSLAFRTPIESSLLRMTILGAPLLLIGIAVPSMFLVRRRQELATDSLMLQTTRNLPAAISMIQKLAAHSERPFSHDEEVGSTHPSTKRRIESLRKVAEELGLGADTGSVATTVST